MKNSDKYQIINNVLYKKEAPPEVIKILEEARLNKTRINILYGDTKTGKVWNHSASGYVSKGSNNLPIILANRRGAGGACIMDASILEIKEARTGKALYTWDFDPNLIVEERFEDGLDSSFKNGLEPLPATEPMEELTNCG